MEMRNKLVIICIFFVLAGCSSSDTNEGVMAPPDSTNNPPDNDDDNTPPSPVSWEADIRVIIQNNCTTCHSDPPRNDAPMSLVTYDDVRNAVENRGLLGRINSTTSPMPPTGRLPAATRQLIEDWADLGFEE
jgi:hypothetical protein